MSVNEKMTAIADNIRAKTGGTEPLTLDGMAESIPEVYSAGQSSMVDESKLIPKTVSGSYISVDDVSEIPHSVGCKVESVNLWRGADTYTVTGTGANQSLFVIGEPIKSTQTFSCVVDIEAVEYSATGNLVFFYATYADGTSATLRMVTASTTSGAVSTQFTASEENPIVRMQMNAHARFTSGTITLSNIMLNRGTTALPYTPYVKPEEVTVTRCGRNLLNPNALGSGEIVEYNGVPCYKYVDKDVSTGRWRIEGCFKENTQYTFTAKIYRPDGSTVKDSNWQIYYTDGTNTNIKGNSGAIVTTISTARKSVSHIATTSYMWETAYLDLSASCLYEGTTALPYEPYNGQTLTPAADGTVEGMTSVSPYMNIFSDTEGVNIEATYNKSYGMQTEYDRFWDSYQQNGNIAYFENLFSGEGWNDFTLNPKYDIKAKGSAYMMFKSCAVTDMVEQLKACGVTLDLTNVTSYTYFLYQAKIKRFGEIPLTHINFKNSTNGTNNMFSSASVLHTIDKIIVNDEGTTQFANSMFNNASSLANITFEGVIGKSINFQWCPLTKASITNIVNTLSSTATGQTLTLKLSAVNTAFETSSGAADGSTSAEFAALVATKTNWTITMV